MKKGQPYFKEEKIEPSQQVTSILSRLKQNIDDTNIPDDWQKLTDQKLLISIYNDLQIVLKSIRVKDYIAAEEIAADISVKMAMLAAEERQS